jgi:hypothetical protein
VLELDDEPVEDDELDELDDDPLLELDEELPLELDDALELLLADEELLLPALDDELRELDDDVPPPLVDDDASGAVGVSVHPARPAAIAATGAPERSNRNSRRRFSSAASGPSVDERRRGRSGMVYLQWHGLGRRGEMRRQDRVQGLRR